MYRFQLKILLQTCCLLCSLPCSCDHVQNYKRIKSFFFPSSSPVGLDLKCATESRLEEYHYFRFCVLLSVGTLFKFKIIYHANSHSQEKIIVLGGNKKSYSLLKSKQLIFSTSERRNARVLFSSMILYEEEMENQCKYSKTNPAKKSYSHLAW